MFWGMGQWIVPWDKPLGPVSFASFLSASPMNDSMDGGKSMGDVRGSQHSAALGTGSQPSPPLHTRAGMDVRTRVQILNT